MSNRLCGPELEAMMRYFSAAKTAFLDGGRDQSGSRFAAGVCRSMAHALEEAATAWKQLERVWLAQHEAYLSSELESGRDNYPNEDQQFEQQVTRLEDLAVGARAFLLSTREEVPVDWLHDCLETLSEHTYDYDEDDLQDALHRHGAN